MPVPNLSAVVQSQAERIRRLESTILRLRSREIDLEWAITLAYALLDAYKGGERFVEQVEHLTEWLARIDPEGKIRDDKGD